VICSVQAFIRGLSLGLDQEVRWKSAVGRWNVSFGRMKAIGIFHCRARTGMGKTRYSQRRMKLLTE
jgi:hypothetical protein